MKQKQRQKQATNKNTFMLGPFPPIAENLQHSMIITLDIDERFVLVLWGWSLLLKFLDAIILVKRGLQGSGWQGLILH